MKFYNVSQISKKIGKSKKAVSKKLKLLTLEEKRRLGSHFRDGNSPYLTEKGISIVFGNELFELKPERTSIVDDLLAEKDKEIARLEALLTRVLSQLDEERKLRYEERTRIDSLMLKFAADLSISKNSIDYRAAVQPTITYNKSIISPIQKELLTNSFRKSVGSEEYPKYSLFEVLKDFGNFIFGYG